MKKIVWVLLTLSFICLFVLSSFNSTGNNPPIDNNQQSTEETSDNSNTTDNPINCQHTFGDWNTAKKSTCKKKRVETAMGESTTYNFTYSMSLDLGKSTSQFQFTEKQGNETITSVKANKVTFATSPAIVTPQRATNKITSYIDKHF